MKALILAAGYGTRLLPYTKSIPKPLFTLCSKPVLAIAIEKLEQAGCTEIIINTHHLHEQIEHYIQKIKTNTKITCLYEPRILDTGGAISNARRFLDDASFFVVNADVVSDIDLNTVYDFHEASDAFATLVLHDFERFNKVKIDKKGNITDFNGSGSPCFAFTGIQVLSPEIYNFFPQKKIFSSIDVYKSLTQKNKIRAYMAEGLFWSDIGTPDDYTATCTGMLATQCLQKKKGSTGHVSVTPVAGDGSDRIWYRASLNDQSAVVSSHGICLPGSIREKELLAFVDIGHHLKKKGAVVPQILGTDIMAGLVILEDLGNTHLQDVIKKDTSASSVMHWYKRVIDRLIEFSQSGIKGFNPDWTCQTPSYSIDLILDKECRYFLDAYLNGFKGLDLSFDTFEKEFRYIAKNAVDYGFMGLMHRDMQSRNIMIQHENVFFIDFQSARTGPLQYDLASLLIDPYVCLDDSLQEQLLTYTLDRLDLLPKSCMDKTNEFIRCYRFCRITRNLQFLGAFSYLSRVKGKKKFEHYIPDALKSLKKNIREIDVHFIPKLFKLIQTL